MGCESQGKDAVQLFLEQVRLSRRSTDSSYYSDSSKERHLLQVDVIQRLVAAHPSSLAWATSAADIETAFGEGRVASLVGVESGHALGSSLAVLRTLYQEGARYLTLTHRWGGGRAWSPSPQL